MNPFFTRAKITFFSFALFILLSFPAASLTYAQTPVAHFSVGEKSNKFEMLSFYVENGERGEISYWYGKDSGEWFGNKGREVKLTFDGTDTFKGEKCFKVGFPNGYTLYIIPKGLNLKVVDNEGKYSKSFRWQYVGPINGVGRWCEECEDEKGSIKLVRNYFLK